MKKKRILALFLAAVSCLSLAVSASAADTTTRKAADFRDYDDAARVVQMGTYNGRCSMFRPWPAQTTFTAEAKSSLRRRNIKGSVLIHTDSGFLDTKRNCRHFDSSFSVTCFSELKIRNTFCIDPSLENSRINKTRINLFLFFRKTERFLSKRDTLH